MIYDAYRAANISATTDSFPLLGGMYGAVYKATWGGGSVTLQVLAEDSATWITAMTAWSADGCANAYLPPGTYRFAVATSTAVYARVSRIPLE